MSESTFFDEFDLTYHVAIQYNQIHHTLSIAPETESIMVGISPPKIIYHGNQ